MQRTTLALILVPMLALGGCGRGDAGDSAREATRAPAGEARAADFDEAARSAAEAEGEAGTLPVAELPPAAVNTAPPESRAGEAAEPGTVRAAADERTQEPRGAAPDLLRRVEQAYADVRSMQADFVQDLTVPLLGSEQRSAGRLYQRRPDRFLMRFTEPAGDIMVADGRHFWMYNPSVDRTQVLRTRIGEGGAEVDLQQQFLSNPNQRFVATLAGEATVGGRASHVVSLVPRGASPYRLIRIWVDQQDHLVRRFEMTEENETVRRIELSDLRLNVSLPDSLFEFSPPAGAQVFDQ